MKRPLTQKTLENLKPGDIITSRLDGKAWIISREYDPSSEHAIAFRAMAISNPSEWWLNVQEMSPNDEKVYRQLWRVAEMAADLIRSYKHDNRLLLAQTLNHLHESASVWLQGNTDNDDVLPYMRSIGGQVPEQSETRE